MGKINEWTGVKNKKTNKSQKLQQKRHKTAHTQAQETNKAHLFKIKAAKYSPNHISCISLISQKPKSTV